MSTVMRPRGPLPPRVYWTRRVVVLLSVLLVALLLWWLLPALGGSGDAATGSPAAGTQTTPPSGSAQTGDGAASQLATGNNQSKAPQSSSKPPTQPSKSQDSPPARSGDQSKGATTTVDKPPLVPSGRCDVSAVKLSVRVESTTEGKGATAGLRMSTSDGSTCTLGISSRSLEARVVSEPATIWDSADCPDALPARNVIVGPKAKVVYSFHWDGRFHQGSCGSSGTVARHGGYWAEAALIGGEPAKAFFAVTAPSSTRAKV